METQNILNSKTYKILLPFVVILSAIFLIKAGFRFGQWFAQILN